MAGDGAADAADTPEAFLAALGTNLQAQPETDAELAGILAARLIKADPERNAVAAARDDILRLAAGRAKREDGGSHDG